MHISYECSELIEELKSDIMEFGGDTIVSVWCRDSYGTTLYTNYDFIIEDAPLEEKEVLSNERIEKMSMSALLVLLEKQNSII